MYGYKTRTDGKCERGNCTKSSWRSYARDASDVRDATKLAIFIPRDRGTKRETETFRVCGIHAGALKRKDEYGYVTQVLDVIPDDIEAAARVAEAELRNRQDENARETRAAIVRRLPEERRSFLAPAEKDAEKMATLKKPDQYGLSYIRVHGQGDSQWSHGLTPAEAESLALRLTQLAADARRLMGATEEELAQ